MDPFSPIPPQQYFRIEQGRLEVGPTKSDKITSIVDQVLSGKVECSSELLTQLKGTFSKRHKPHHWFFKILNTIFGYNRRREQKLDKLLAKTVLQEGRTGFQRLKLALPSVRTALGQSSRSVLQEHIAQTYRAFQDRLAQNRPVEKRELRQYEETFDRYESSLQEQELLATQFEQLGSISNPKYPEKNAGVYGEYHSFIQQKQELCSQQIAFSLKTHDRQVEALRSLVERAKRIQADIEGKKAQIDHIEDQARRLSALQQDFALPESADGLSMRGQELFRSFQEQYARLKAQLEERGVEVEESELTDLASQCGAIRESEAKRQASLQRLHGVMETLSLPSLPCGIKKKMDEIQERIQQDQEVTDALLGVLSALKQGYDTLERLKEKARSLGEKLSQPASGIQQMDPGGILREECKTKLESLIDPLQRALDDGETPTFSELEEALSQIEKFNEDCLQVHQLQQKTFLNSPATEIHNGIVHAYQEALEKRAGMLQDFLAALRDAFVQGFQAVERWKTQWTQVDQQCSQLEAEVRRIIEQRQSLEAMQSEIQSIEQSALKGRAQQVYDEVKRKIAQVSTTLLQEENPVEESSLQQLRSQIEECRFIQSQLNQLGELESKYHGLQGFQRLFEQVRGLIEKSGRTAEERAYIQQFLRELPKLKQGYDSILTVLKLTLRSEEAELVPIAEKTEVSIRLQALQQECQTYPSSDPMPTVEAILEALHEKGVRCKAMTDQVETINKNILGHQKIMLRGFVERVKFYEPYSSGLRQQLEAQIASEQGKLEVELERTGWSKAFQEQLSEQVKTLCRAAIQQEKADNERLLQQFTLKFPQPLPPQTEPSGMSSVRHRINRMLSAHMAPDVDRFEAECQLMMDLKAGYEQLEQVKALPFQAKSSLGTAIQASFALQKEALLSKAERELGSLDQEQLMGARQDLSLVQSMSVFLQKIELMGEEVPALSTVESVASESALYREYLSLREREKALRQDMTELASQFKQNKERAAMLIEDLSQTRELILKMKQRIRRQVALHSAFTQAKTAIQTQQATVDSLLRCAQEGGVTFKSPLVPLEELIIKANETIQTSLFDDESDSAMLESLQGQSASLSEAIAEAQRRLKQGLDTAFDIGDEWAHFAAFFRHQIERRKWVREVIEAVRQRKISQIPEAGKKEALDREFLTALIEDIQPLHTSSGRTQSLSLEQVESKLRSRLDGLAHCLPVHEAAFSLCDDLFHQRKDDYEHTMSETAVRELKEARDAYFGAMQQVRQNDDVAFKFLEAKYLDLQRLAKQQRGTEQQDIRRERLGTYYELVKFVEVSFVTAVEERLKKQIRGDDARLLQKMVEDGRAFTRQLKSAEDDSQKFTDAFLSSSFQEVYSDIQQLVSGVLTGSKDMFLVESAFTIGKIKDTIKGLLSIEGKVSDVSSNDLQRLLDLYLRLHEVGAVIQEALGSSQGSVRELRPAGALKSRYSEEMAGLIRKTELAIDRKRMKERLTEGARPAIDFAHSLMEKGKQELASLQNIARSFHLEGCSRELETVSDQLSIPEEADPDLTSKLEAYPKDLCDKIEAVQSHVRERLRAAIEMESGIDSPLGQLFQQVQGVAVDQTEWEAIIDAKAQLDQAKVAFTTSLDEDTMKQYRAAKEVYEQLMEPEKSWLDFQADKKSMEEPIQQLERQLEEIREDDPTRAALKSRLEQLKQKRQSLMAYQELVQTEESFQLHFGKKRMSDRAPPFEDSLENFISHMNEVSSFLETWGTNYPRERLAHWKSLALQFRTIREKGLPVLQAFKLARGEPRKIEEVICSGQFSEWMHDLALYSREQNFINTILVDTKALVKRLDNPSVMDRSGKEKKKAALKISEFLSDFEGKSIEATQRPVRYNLLLKEMRKHTPPTEENQNSIYLDRALDRCVALNAQAEDARYTVDDLARRSVILLDLLHLQEELEKKLAELKKSESEAQQARLRQESAELQRAIELRQGPMKAAYNQYERLLSLQREKSCLLNEIVQRIEERIRLFSISAHSDRSRMVPGKEALQSGAIQELLTIREKVLELKRDHDQLMRAFFLTPLPTSPGLEGALSEAHINRLKEALQAPQVPVLSPEIRGYIGKLPLPTYINLMKKRDGTEQDDRLEREIKEMPIDVLVQKTLRQFKSFSYPEEVVLLEERVQQSRHIEAPLAGMEEPRSPQEKVEHYAISLRVKLKEMDPGEQKTQLQTYQDIISKQALISFQIAELLARTKRVVQANDMYPPSEKATDEQRAVLQAFTQKLERIHRYFNNLIEAIRQSGVDPTTAAEDLCTAAHMDRLKDVFLSEDMVKLSEELKDYLDVLNQVNQLPEGIISRFAPRSTVNRSLLHPEKPMCQCVAEGSNFSELCLGCTRILSLTYAEKLRDMQKAYTAMLKKQLISQSDFSSLQQSLGIIQAVLGWGQTWQESPQWEARYRDAFGPLRDRLPADILRSALDAGVSLFQEINASMIDPSRMASLFTSPEFQARAEPIKALVQAIVRMQQNPKTKIDDTLSKKPIELLRKILPLLNNMHVLEQAKKESQPAVVAQLCQARDEVQRVDEALRTLSQPLFPELEA